jgi:putative ABC transport system substrate-binding protein
VKRREFIALLGGAAATWPFAARGQQPAHKLWRLGILEATPREMNGVNLGALQKGLGEHGYIEGRNLAVEYRSADGRADLFPKLASDLVGLKVDLIVTRGTPAVLAAKNVTSTLPVVMAASGEPLDVGVIAGLAHPGGNVTGLSAFTTESELKRLELLRECVPRLTRLAALYNMSNPVSSPRWEAIRAAERTLGIEARLLDVRTPEDLESAFELAVRQRAEAVIVGNDGLIQANRRSVVGLAARHKLPAVYAFRDIVDDGGLMSYSVNYSHLYYRAARFVDKIFKGAKPADLPVEQPTKFELVINLKTTKALGLQIPDMLLARADEVIE